MVFLEIQNVTLWSLFPNPVTYKFLDSELSAYCLQSISFMYIHMTEMQNMLRNSDIADNFIVLLYHILHTIIYYMLPANTHRHTQVHTHAHTCTHTGTHIHTNTHTYTCTHKYTHSHTYTCTHTDTHKHTHIHTHTKAHKHTHTSTHTYTQAHTHTHTHKQAHTCRAHPKMIACLLHRVCYW